MEKKETKQENKVDVVKVQKGTDERKSGSKAVSDFDQMGGTTQESDNKKKPKRKMEDPTVDEEVFTVTIRTKRPRSFTSNPKRIVNIKLPELAIIVNNLKLVLFGARVKPVQL